MTAGVTALAAAAGRPAAGLVAVALAVLSGQLATGWSNDWLDAERDAAVGRTDKPVATGEVSRSLVGTAAVVAGLACVPLSLLSGWRAGLVHLVAVACALAYNARLKATPFSALPYALAFAAAPAFVTLARPGHPWPPAWLLVAGAALGAGAHFANVLSDLDDDAATGIRGVPHRLGRPAAEAIAAGLMALVAVLLTVGPPGPPTPLAWSILGTTAVVLGAGAALGRRRGSRTLFRAVLITALGDVVLLLLSGSAL
ncbi:4-hydroxybenzoate polyprenyltransferase-like prenyltransferase [Cryptosporangium arvum DSM 44712]|uniref:4-hydroxybenzoate polyprenyltransferase-like prenyltransferase n=1 Tax=Cryptosporangium arvum DSM 44712 TaxID=927661 RepID=A0A011ABK4_9ACTN|nr:UbiA family prenyltransferase [Cryptosporangium arvum]EXG79401.1 4-hydroxybenzoate polyprenyltransferase-like prenyltransferase [Cryptosporangium arvum DSM 44712]